MKNSKLKIIILGMTVGLAGVVGVNYLLADWSAPGEGPTEGNVRVPVNVGGAAQEKTGGLWVGTGLNDNQTSFVARFGRVGVGTVSPDTSVHINATNGVGGFGISDVIQRLEIFRSGANVGPALDFVSQTSGGARWSRAAIKGSAVNTADQSGYLSFFTRPESGNLQERMRIESGGNIRLFPNTILSIDGAVGSTGQVLTRTANGMAWQPASGGLPGGGADQTLRHDGTNWVATNNFRVNNAGSLVAGSIPWTRLTSFPVSCPSGQFVRAVGSTLTCEAPSGGGQTPNLQQVTDVGATTNNLISVRANSNQIASIAFGTGGNNRYFIGRPANQTYFNIFDANRGTNGLDILRSVGNNLLLQPDGGDVGIGVTPSGKLDVGGNTHFRGNLSFSPGAKTVEIPSGTLNIRQDGTNRITLQGITRHVGINEFTPASELHVVDPTPTSGSFSTATFTGVGAGGGIGQSVIALTTEYALGNSIGSDWDPNYGHSQGWGIIARGASSNYEPNSLAFGFWSSRTGGWREEPMKLVTNENLFDLKVSGDVYARNVKLSSDLNLKQNINTLSNSLSKILELRGVSFNWKDREDDSEQIGFIAQEVEQIFPELVKGEEGGKSVNYVSLVPVLVEAVKELDAKNKELEARLEKLESRLGIIAR